MHAADCLASEASRLQETHIIDLVETVCACASAASTSQEHV